MKILLYFNICFSFVIGQGWYNHPELDWHTIETEHFLIHYHIETKRSAEETAAIAEHIYSFFSAKPAKYKIRTLIVFKKNAKK